MAKVKALMGSFYGRNIPKPRLRTTGNTRDDDDDIPTDRRVPYSTRHNVFHRSTKDKIVKIRKTMKALWKKAHPMDDNFKRVTCAVLNNLGHNVHSCRGEADVCISTQGGEIYSFSGDSDFLYHPIHTFVRKDPKDPTTMLAYPTQEARTSFNLTPAGMTALAVVSRNDYSVHVQGYSLKKNLKVFQSINGAKPSDAIHLSSEVLVTRYCLAVSKPWEITNPTRLSSAMDIFVHHQETFSDRPVPSSTMSFNHGSLLSNLVQEVVQGEESITLDDSDPRLESEDVRAFMDKMKVALALWTREKRKLEEEAKMIAVKDHRLL
ncbi:hypothetical protein EC957_001336 [Mortierella hygrophila]|uniref:Uncharacterized protein n=1 Tax=Mortierella hygrophila TaxID=979708 RepID=A0A9P6F4Y8_9FUNG|nr:hypothetical protein EC957_001336 [Mortierella hygrophila]